MNNLTTWFLNSENQQVSENITDAPPITFNSNGEPLTNWKITGSQAGVGNATKNLFDIYAATQGYKIDTQGQLVEDKDYLVSDFISCALSNPFSISFDYVENASVDFIWYDENKNYISFSRYFGYGTEPSFLRKKIESIEKYNQNTKYFRISVSNIYKDIMLTKTSAAQEYEPYGYKIPVECGNTITNIYIDEPLYEEDSIGYKDVKITIPTVDGENELDIGTTNAPTSVSIQTNGISQGFRDYFKAQMMINND